MGVMNFEPRQEGAKALFIKATGPYGEDGNNTVKVAELWGTQGHDHMDSLYLLRREGNFKQASYLFSPLSWGVGSNSQSLGKISNPTLATEISNLSAFTPLPPEPFRPWVTTSPGTYVVQEATLWFTATENGKADALAIQLLSDGNSVGFSNGMTLIPTPVPGLPATPIPTEAIIPPSSYPSPSP